MQERAAGRPSASEGICGVEDRPERGGGRGDRRGDGRSPARRLERRTRAGPDAGRAPGLGPPDDLAHVDEPVGRPGLPAGTDPRGRRQPGPRPPHLCARGAARPLELTRSPGAPERPGPADRAHHGLRPRRPFRSPSGRRLPRRLGPEAARLRSRRGLRAGGPAGPAQGLDRRPAAALHRLRGPAAGPGDLPVHRGQGRLEAHFRRPGAGAGRHQPAGA